MYYFYLGELQLPVTPSKLELKVTNQNKTLTLINEGEISFLKLPGLSEVSFTAAFPSVQRPYAIYPQGFVPPDQYLAALELLKINRLPFQFIVTRMSPRGELLFDQNLTVSLEEYKITEDAKNGSEVEVSITLKQYRAFETEILES